MLKVYSYEFACACLDAGITYGFFWSSVPEDDIVKLVDKYGGDKLFLTFTLHYDKPSSNLQLLKRICNLGVKNFEFTENNDNDRKTVDDTNLLKKTVSFFGLRGYEIYSKRSLNLVNNVDGVVVKGKEAAARGTQNDLLTEFSSVKKTYPNKKIIASGGIYTGKQVKQYLDLGAHAVSIGTLFAASTESPISDAAKQAILSANKRNLKRFSNSQQSLVFTCLNADDENHTQGLSLGIETGTQGHLFLGHAVDHITEIKPVAEIVAELSSHLV